jgi:hypothetical protein
MDTHKRATSTARIAEALVAQTETLEKISESLRFLCRGYYLLMQGQSVLDERDEEAMHKIADSIGLWSEWFRR